MQRDQPDRRVAVTGVGAVCGLGWGVAALWAGLRAGQPGIGPFQRFDHSQHRTHLAAEAEAPPALLARACPGWRRLSIADRFALFAALEAVGRPVWRRRSARRPRPGSTSAAARAACSRASSSSPGSCAIRRRAAPLRPDPAAGQRSGRRGGAPPRGHRAGGDLSPPPAPPGRWPWARRWRRCARARWRWRSPAAPTPSASSPMPASTPCARWTRSPAGRSAPSRAGMSFGEGAAVLVLEPLERALARGAEPLAVLAGAGASCDAHHMTAPDPAGSRRRGGAGGGAGGRRPRRRRRSTSSTSTAPARRSTTPPSGRRCGGCSASAPAACRWWPPRR